jgi:hypothetical protein
MGRLDNHVECLRRARVALRQEQAAVLGALKKTDSFRIGAGLPAKTAFPKDEREKLSDLRSYDFGAAIAALQTMDSQRAIRGGALSNDRLKSRPEPTDNTMLIVGAESTAFYQRVPVPLGMWRPFNRISVPLRLNAPGVLVIDNQRVAVLICHPKNQPMCQVRNLVMSK